MFQQRVEKKSKTEDKKASDKSLSPIEALKQAKTAANKKSADSSKAASPVVEKVKLSVPASPVTIQAEEAAEPVPKPKSAKPALAPWAAATKTKAQQPVKSLDEIQREEAIKRNKEIENQKKMEEEDRMLAAKIALEETANEPQDTLDRYQEGTTTYQDIG
ncbi:unnamed protein product [Ambrosiozyma monospora]|uniref:Unnamed protein product n=1 Tax=Ambrosiozyma monospora TaxID=43982 RepID=A0ACB5UAN6_AMBMO|nr:unnamed protein product [Ambrosiozyma monospora]